MIRQRRARHESWAALLLALVGPLGAGDHQAAGASSVPAGTRVPAAEALAAIAEEYGVKVVYVDMEPPRQPVAPPRERATARAAITDILQQMGARYALRDAAKGGDIDMVVIVGGGAPPLAAPGRGDPEPDTMPTAPPDSEVDETASPHMVRPWRGDPSAPQPTAAPPLVPRQRSPR